MEITTIKSSRAEYPASEREEVTERLQRVTVTVERNGNELVITSDFPRHDFFLPSFRSGANLLQHHSVGFDLLYRIRVPRNTRILVNHDVGRVFIVGVTSDIDATLRGGDLLLHLPQEAQYTIDAKADAGHVNSDYPGEQKGRLWRIGHEIVTQGPPSSHKLNLRVGFGDIIILKTQTPEAPRPLASAATKGGQ